MLRWPTPPWRGMHSTPRELRLVAAGDDLLLAQRPIREVETLRGPESTVAPAEVAGRRVLPFSGDALDAEAVLRLGTARTFGLAVRVGDGEETLVGYDVGPSKKGSLYNRPLPVAVASLDDAGGSPSDPDRLTGALQDRRESGLASPRR